MAMYMAMAMAMAAMAVVWQWLPWLWCNHGGHGNCLRLLYILRAAPTRYCIPKGIPNDGVSHLGYLLFGQQGCKPIAFVLAGHPNGHGCNPPHSTGWACQWAFQWPHYGLGLAHVYTNAKHPSRCNCLEFLQLNTNLRHLFYTEQKSIHMNSFRAQPFI